MKKYFTIFLFLFLPVYAPADIGIDNIFDAIDAFEKRPSSNSATRLSAIILDQYEAQDGILYFIDYKSNVEDAQAKAYASIGLGKLYDELSEWEMANTAYREADILLGLKPNLERNQKVYWEEYLNRTYDFFSLINAATNYERSPDEKRAASMREVLFGLNAIIVSEAVKSSGYLIGATDQDTLVFNISSLSRFQVDEMKKLVVYREGTYAGGIEGGSYPLPSGIARSRTPYNLQEVLSPTLARRIAREVTRDLPMVVDYVLAKALEPILDVVVSLLHEQGIIYEQVLSMHSLIDYKGEDVMKLVTVEYTFSNQSYYRVDSTPWLKDWFGVSPCQADVVIDWTARARASFNLAEGMVLRVNQNTRTVTVILLRPEIDLEITDTEYGTFEEGICGEIGSELINRAGREIRVDALRTAKFNGIEERAMESARNNFKRLLSASIATLANQEYKVDIIFVNQIAPVDLKGEVPKLLNPEIRVVVPSG